MSFNLEHAYEDGLPGFVYFIRCVGTKLVKIGYSNNPITRMESLQTANAHKLKFIAIIPGTHRDEKRAQQEFRHQHVRGEWFEMSAAQETAIRVYVMQCQQFDRLMWPCQAASYGSGERVAKIGAA